MTNRTPLDIAAFLAGFYGIVTLAASVITASIYGAAAGIGIVAAAVLHFGMKRGD